MRRFFLLLLMFLQCHAVFAQLFRTLSSAQTGFNFFNQVKETSDLNIFLQKYPYMGFSGAGVCLADFNKDGLTDIVMLGNQLPSKIFKNNGNMKFEDVTKQSGFSTQQWTNGIATADVNNDGLLDIFVTKLSYPDSSKAGNLLFINKGNFIFEEQSQAYGLHFVGNSVHASFLDYDADGFMDLYLINQPLESFEENTFDIYNQNKTYGQSDILYHNEAGKSLKDVSSSAGILPENAFGLSVVTGDFNQDNHTDIYVCNDYVHPDVLYINNGNGTFTNRLAEFFDHSSMFTMGSAFADLNNDGLSDLVTLDMNPLAVSEYKIATFDVPIDKYNLITKNHFRQEVRNMLQLNRGNNHFSEVGQLAGVAFSDWSWAVLAEDFDCDGNRDLFITNGLVQNTLDRDYFKYAIDSALKAQGKSSYSAKPSDIYQLVKMKPRKVKNQLHLNGGNLNFTNCLDCGTSQTWVTTAAASADLDNDGDLDLVLSNSDTNSLILENTTKNGNYLAVRFQNPNQAYNAKVQLWAIDKTYYQEITNVQGILCSKSPEAFFGLGNNSSIDSMRVSLANGSSFLKFNPNANQIITLSLSDFSQQATGATKTKEVLYEKSAIAGFDYTHTENVFNDIKKEPLLPHQLNAFGPYAAMGDLDSNGWDDLVIGGSSGTALKVYFQDKNGSLSLVEQQVFKSDLMKEDAGIVLFDANGDTYLDIYVVSGGNENFPDSTYYQDRLYLNDGKGKFSKCKDCIPTEAQSGSEALAFDFDADGDLDLFVGGRNQPGKYPLTPTSMLLRNDKGYFSNITPAILQKPGMVTSVQAADFNKDGFPELILAGEWMPVLLFRNMDGTLQPPDTLFSEGFWQHLNVADFNGDSLLDIFAANLGLNTRFVPSHGKEIRIYAADIDDNGSLDPLVCTQQEGKWKPVLPYEKLIREVPTVRKILPQYRSYRDAGIGDILGTKLNKAVVKKCFEAHSGIAIQTNEGMFKSTILTEMLQSSPISTSIFASRSGVGGKDMLLHGNFYENAPEVGPSDAADGMFIPAQNLKENTFKAVNSGFKVKGNVRKMLWFKTPAGYKIIVLKNNDKAEVWEPKNIK